MNQDEHYIQELIYRGEGENLDFKYHVADAKKIAITLVAFSNTSGGTLLLGVKDNGKISGIQTDEELYMIETASHLFCKPEVPFEIKEWEVEGKIVLEIIIPAGKDKPYFAKDEKGRFGVFIRIGDKNKFANRVIVEYLKRKTKKENTFIPYSVNEKILLNYLKENRAISLKEFISISNISRRKAEDILINLLSAGILSFGHDGKIFTYSLKPE